MNSNQLQRSRSQLGWEDVVGFLDTPSNFLWLAASLVVVWAIAWAVSDAAAMNNAFQGLAFLVGGFWVLYQFVLRRSFESGLEIDVEVTTSPDSQAERFVAFVNVSIKNIGNRRITAPPNLSEADINDLEHSVAHPSDLTGCANRNQQHRNIRWMVQGTQDWNTDAGPRGTRARAPALRIHQRRIDRFLHGAWRVLLTWECDHAASRGVCRQGRIRRLPHKSFRILESSRSFSRAAGHNGDS